MIIKRGDIYYADLRPVIGSEQGGIRPVLIIQNDTGNKHSPTVICAAITSKMNKAKLPTHVELCQKYGGHRAQHHNGAQGDADDAHHHFFAFLLLFRGHKAFPSFLFTGPVLKDTLQ